MLKSFPPTRYVCAVIVLTACLARAAGAQNATDLAIHVVSASFRYGSGSEDAYNVAIGNVGTAAANADIHVTSTLPAGVSFLSAQGNGWTCSAGGQQVDCVTHAALAIGASSSFTILVSVCDPAFPSVTTTLRVAYPADTNSANNTVTRTTSVRAGECLPPTATPGVSRSATPSPTRAATGAPTSTRTPIPNNTDLALLKGTSGAFTVGANGVYTLTVSNVGTATANTPITVTDALPTGLGFVSGSGAGWTCGHSGQVVTCTNPGPLAVGTSTSFTLTVSVSSAAYPTITNTATVAYAADTNSANDTAQRPTTVRLAFRSPVATATVAGARTSTPTPTPTPTPAAGNAAATDLSLGKTTSGTFAVGSNGVYALTVTNVGAAATNAPITVTDTLPNGLSFVSADGGTRWSCSSSGQTVTCTTVTPILAGAASTISLTVNVGTAAYPTVTNSARVSYPGDTNTANDTASRPTTVRASAPPPSRPHPVRSPSSSRPQHPTVHRLPHRVQS
jgi:uncharacterized repeat protein (TIGR01451 family)